jgi:hypothetical protein
MFELSSIELAVTLAALSGLSIRIGLTIVQQKWASTYHHTMSYILLPVITLTITKVITGNIALSLGMIGALSIVRFRNPVKNPFELVVFFALITIGISMAVNTKYGLMLTAVILFVIIISYILEIIATKLNLNIYSLSFHEGSKPHVLEVVSKGSVILLESSALLIQHVNNKKKNQHFYRLASNNKYNLKELSDSINKIDGIESIEINYA